MTDDAMAQALARCDADWPSRRLGCHRSLRPRQPDADSGAGRPRLFRNFSTLAGYLKALGITECRVNLAEYEPGAKDGTSRRGVAAAERMRAAHAAAEYDRWFRAQVHRAKSAGGGASSCKASSRAETLSILSQPQSRAAATTASIPREPMRLPSEKNGKVKYI